MQGGRERQIDLHPPGGFPPALSEEVSWCCFDAADITQRFEAGRIASWPRFASPHWKGKGKSLSSAKIPANEAPTSQQSFNDTNDSCLLSSI